MYCPNCGASNSKKQNYCRFCGLNLRDAAKSLTNQIVFGEDSDLLKSLSSVKRVIDLASAALAGVLIIYVLAYLFIEPGFGKGVMKVSLGVLFLLKFIQEIIGYYQRKERGKARANKFEQGATAQSGSQAAAKFPEERPFEPVPSVLENSTELLPIENKTRKLEEYS
jgi:hypothetical protein